MRYERLVNEAHPVTHDVAFLYHDDGNPVPNAAFDVDLIEYQRGQEGPVLGTATGRTGSIWKPPGGQ